MDVYQRPAEIATAPSNVEAIRVAIIDRYPPCISVQALSGLIDRTVASIRVAVSTPNTEFDCALRAARFWIGGRVQFQTVIVAAAIAAERARSDQNGHRATAIVGKHGKVDKSASVLSLTRRNRFEVSE